MDQATRRMVVAFEVDGHLGRVEITCEPNRDLARSFLAASPDRIMTRRLVPLCGFAWGYRLRDQQPSSIAPVEIGAVEWGTAQARLRADHPSWTFESWLG